MDTTLAQLAVKQALQGNWAEAIKTNEEILKEYGDDVDSLNRIARAQMELGCIKKAKSAATKALKLNPDNSIALKMLAKLETRNEGECPCGKISSPDDFLEEPGKTKMMYLMHPGDTKVISSIDAGDEVKLDAHSHRLEILTEDGKYVGRLPDDLSARIKMLINCGNEYKVVVKCVENGEVKVILREVKNVSGTPSFPAEKIEYVSFTPPELVHKNDMDTSDGSEEEPQVQEEHAEMV
jgi:tetratricopeptide (TPR) repeat protein